MYKTREETHSFASTSSNQILTSFITFMASNQTPQSAGRVYEDFEPQIKWSRELGCQTLIVSLQGFRKDQLMVQITARGTLRISGEQGVGEGNKRRRFLKEFQIPSDCEITRVSAKYEGETLYVRMPETIISDNNIAKDNKTAQEDQEKAAPKDSTNNITDGKQTNEKANAAEKREETKKSDGMVAEEEVETSNMGKYQSEAGGEANGNSLAPKTEKEAATVPSGRFSFVGNLVMELRKPKNFILILVLVKIVLFVLISYHIGWTAG